MTNLEKNFKDKIKYKFIGSGLLFTPNGMVEKGTVLTGMQWKQVLVYDLGDNIHFSRMFKTIKKKVKKEKTSGRSS